MLDNFMYLYRTRLFDDKWTVVQQWTTVTVGWIAGYLNKKFVIEIKKGGTVVIVLGQVCTPFFSNSYHGRFLSAYTSLFSVAR